MPRTVTLKIPRSLSETYPGAGLDRALRHTGCSATVSSTTPLLVIGALLVLGALLAGLAHRSFLSLTAVFVLAGFVLGNGGLGVLDFEPRGRTFVDDLAIVALIVILFRDGLEVEAEMLQREWRAAAPQAACWRCRSPRRSSPSATKLLTDLTLDRSRSCSARCSRPPTRCCPRASSPTRACPG